jgi:hypothetical protein
MPFGVAAGTTYDDANPAVAYNPDHNNYLVVWERSLDIEGPHIFGAMIDGTTAGPPFPIDVSNPYQFAPDVAYSSAAGRYLVVWEDHGAGWMPPPDIEAASLNGTGGEPQSIHVAPEPNDVWTGLQTRPSVAAHGTLPRWLVTWEDTRTSATTGVDIYGQQVTFDGSTTSLFGGQFAIGAQSGDAQMPDVAWGAVGVAGGEYLTVWSEGEWLFARRLGAGGALLGGIITVSSYTGSNKWDPAVVYASASKAWWVVWADSRDYG